VNPTLQGYSAAVLESTATDQRSELANDLESVEQVVLGNSALRSALTDTALDGNVRRSVMLDLLEGKVSEAARRLAAFACSAVSAPDVPSALQWVAGRAFHVAEGRYYAEESLSLTGARNRVGGFAAALYEGLDNDQLESMEDDLFRFARIVAATPALRSALVDRDLDIEARQALIGQLLDGKVADATLALVRYVVRGGRARDFVGTLDWLVEQTAKARGWRIARVRAASPIANDQRASLEESLSGLAHAPVELQVEIDDALLSGAVIQIGDLRVDASARGRLENLREHMKTAGWEDSGLGTRRGGQAATATSTGTTTGTTGTTTATTTTTTTTQTEGAS